MNQSQCLFKIEAKVDIKSYHGDINTLNLYHWVQQLELYFNVHEIKEEHKNSFSQLKLEGHALNWWESNVKNLRLEAENL